MSQLFSSSQDRYTVEREYARGGMGITYLVTSEKSNTRLILKQLRLDRVSDWKTVELFEREAEVLRQLNHPQIPRYIDYFQMEDNKQFCLVQSFIDGRTLQNLIDTQSPIDIALFVSYFEQCTNILVYLHGLVPPVVHRDITPKNIIVHNGTAYLVDFGSVKSAITPSQESTATSVGTFGYMPPEQIMGRAVPASDIFSLAMTFIALASHCDPSLLPLDNSSGQVDVHRVLGHLSVSITDVLERMTAMGLDKRLGDARQVLEMLHRPTPTPPPKASSRAAIKTPSYRPATIVSKNQPRDQSKRFDDRWYVVGGVGIAALAIVLFFVFLNFSQSGETQAESAPKRVTPATKKEIKPIEPKTVQLLTNIPTTSLQRILTSSEWTGHEGQDEARLVFKTNGAAVIGELTNWDQRKKAFTGDITPVFVRITQQGTLMMTARRTNEGVVIENTFYGNLTHDSLMIVGTGEKLYRQSGSEYTTEFKWQFTRSNPN